MSHSSARCRAICTRYKPMRLHATRALESGARVVCECVAEVPVYWVGLRAFERIAEQRFGNVVQ
eukprot:9804542-Lingulodinium_polyedra.AAC.1